MVSHLDLLNLNIEKFRPYLQNDEALGEKDTVELHVLLQKLEKRRQEINRTINVLSITMDALRRSHDELNASIFSYRSLLSPIRNIPDEVLGEIFTYTLPTTRNAFPIHTEVPLLLTSICKRWRNVAYSTPRLWSKLHVVLPTSMNEHTSNEAEGLWRRTYVSTVKRFLGLSGSVPLSLSITYLHNSRQGKFLPESKELLDSVIQQSHRWCDIDIKCGPETMQYIDERIVKCPSGAISLPLLRRLRTRPSAQSITHTVDDFNLLYTYSMPSLRELSLYLSSSCYTFPFAELQAAPYWHSLTRLTIPCFEYDVQLLLDLLPRCQELQELLLGITEWVPTPTTPASVYLPKLSKLTLQGGSARDSSLYGCLDTPLLAQLSLYPAYCYRVVSGDENVPQRKPVVHDFIAQCRNLQSLVMSPRNIDEEIIRSVLEADPGITALILDPSEVLLNTIQIAPPAPTIGSQMATLIEALALLTNTSTPSSSGPLLSNLKSCSFLHLSITQEDADTILEFCKSRMVQHPTSASTGNQPPVASLDHIKMVLIKEKSVVDIRQELLEYAESIGRRVGEDIVIDITYPWGDQIQWIPHPFLDPRSDLNHETGYTWDMIDA